ncbi:MAG TPA: hypothetical protein VKE24_15480 [Candidatus Acidoferrales bacterium]|nr:hypothetical protein [Candidatus Acidoferrales bacterium]
MSDSGQRQFCVLRCKAPVPRELEAEGLCVLHLILSLEHVCAEMRRETAVGKANATRQVEIANYVTAAAVKLSYVSTGNLRLSDELKKRILTTLLTLMNVRESLERAANHSVPELRATRSVAPAPAVMSS